MPLLLRIFLQWRGSRVRIVFKQYASSLAPNRALLGYAALCYCGLLFQSTTVARHYRITWTLLDTLRNLEARGTGVTRYAAHPNHFGATIVCALVRISNSIFSSSFTFTVPPAILMGMIPNSRCLKLAVPT
jgi:hypothetical protein